MWSHLKMFSSLLFSCIMRKFVTRCLFFLAWKQRSTKLSSQCQTRQCWSNMNQIIILVFCEAVVRESLWPGRHFFMLENGLVCHSPAGAFSGLMWPSAFWVVVPYEPKNTTVLFLWSCCINFIFAHWCHFVIQAWTTMDIRHAHLSCFSYA